jgi:benzodiazapine receptor
MSRKIKDKFKYFAVIYWIIGFEIISYSMGLITRNNMDWYKLLNKSALTPPGYIFSVVWVMLYVTLAISSYLLYQKKEEAKIRQILFLFLLQMLCNWIWTPIFFGLHQIQIALGILMLTILLTAYIMMQSLKYYRIITYILLPYFLWLLFAAYLNGMVYILN